MNRLFGRPNGSAAAAAATAPTAPAAAPAASQIGGGPPALLASDASYSDAIRQLNLASLKEDSGDLRTARECYESGLGLLLGLLKARFPAGTGRPELEQGRDWLRQLLHTQMSKAERLKDKMAVREGNAPANHAVAPSASLLGLGQPGQVARANSGPVRHANNSPSDVRSGSASASPVSNSAASASAPRENIDPALRAAIEGEILRPSNGGVTFASIVGLDDAKAALKEMVILPSLRPDLFSGIRSPPKGLLLYGPPGNGKSFIASAVATESQATFFSVSAASLVSKHLGEGERLVRALFAVARERAPSIVFVDEIDSIMGRRGADEHEASRRLKTEFFIQMDGVSGKSDNGAGRVIVLAATNCPEDLDEALIRRLQRRIYLDVPSAPARLALLQSLFARPPGLKHSLNASDMDSLVAATKNYSNSDLTALVSDAALAPLREIPPDKLMSTPANSLPPVTLAHFQAALVRVRPSVSEERLKEYKRWADKQDATR